MIYDASERVRETIAPHWSAMANYQISWETCQPFLSSIENDLQTLSLAAASSETPLPTVHMMTVLNLAVLALIPDDESLPIWVLDHHRINSFKKVIKSVAGSQAFSWTTPLPHNQYGALPDPYDIPLLDSEDVAPPVVPQPAPSIPGSSHTKVSSPNTNLVPTDDSRQQSVDRQIADKNIDRPKPKPSYKKTTARPSNLPGEPPVVISRPSVVIPINAPLKTNVPEDSTPKPVEDKSGEDAEAPSDPLALRRPPRAVAVKAKEALDAQAKSSRKRPRESSPEVDDKYKNSNANSSDEESLAVATKKQRQSKDTTTSSKASSSKDAGSSKKTSTAKNAASGSSKRTTANKDTGKKKPAAKKAKTPAPPKVDKGKGKAVSENPDAFKKVVSGPPNYDLPGKVVDSGFLRDRMALVTGDLKKLETPPSFPGLKTLPYLTPAEYIAQDIQHARLFPVRPGRAPSTTKKDYPDVSIASHRLGAGYSLKDLVETTRNIGAARQVIADNKVVTCAACAAGTHTKTCVPMGVGLPCVACRSSGIPCSLNSELDRLEVSSRTGYEIFAQCSPVIANQLRRINATTYSFVAASGLADTIKFNLGSEITVRTCFPFPDKNLKITPELVSNIGQLAGWTVSYSQTDIEDFLAQPAPAEEASFHPAAASSSERATVPPPSLSDFFLPIGNKPTPIDVSQWVHFMDAQNPLRPEINSALKAGVPYPKLTLPSEGLSVSDVAIPTAVHPGSVDSPVDPLKAVTSHADAAMASPAAASTLMDAENTSRKEEEDEASSRDEDVTKAFNQSLELGTPESFLHSSVIRSSPPITVLSQEKDEDNHMNNEDDEEEQDIEEDLVNELDSSPIRPSMTH
ncbi:hypothetical protein K435DRAFT_870850 [Dendrothele bispora CBS 962.96]|uniref:Zn(2)-C6 fungal-type domain-containing protein n=1 Tax=Dendrothele bispora (strain CBS 962.96) TaxID=1314807 RepID=A0A4S8L5J0_DENBC|nr:hypothetical protein K435DRAFT_870850 [Dendrothele bispora CBS 962.96]